MNWWTKFLMGQMLLLDEAGDGKGGGGGSGGDPEKELADLKAANEALKKENDGLKAKGGGGGNGGGGKDDPSLADKARLEREQKDKQTADTKNLERAVVFNQGAKQWLKDNSSLLPETIAGILDVAEKEKFDSAQDKASTLKVNIVTEFFAKQSNLDLLTASQKQKLADFNELTKNVKQERVSDLYEAIFEPTLEMLRKVKKAEALQKGLAEPTDTEDAYLKKIMKTSRQHHLREKQ